MFCHDNIMDKMFDFYEVLSLILLSSVLYFSDVCFDLYYVCVLVNMIGYVLYVAVNIVLRIMARLSIPTMDKIDKKIYEEYDELIAKRH